MSGESNPSLVSVIIPCYDQAQFLPDAVESALSQTYLEIEVVVVDDGSPDNTGEVVARYPSVRYIRQENRGLAGARNAGFHASRGEYVVFLDADDRLTPNAVEAHLCCFEKRLEAGFVVGDIDQIATDGSYIYSPRWPIVEANHYEELLKANHVANTIAVMFRRSVIERLGGFDASCSPAEDYELLLRAARLFPSAHHRTVVAQYRRHPATLSRKGTAMLPSMHRVMQMQRPIVNGNRRLRRAWRQGDRYWREHFGIATIKQLSAHLRCCELWHAVSAVVALLRYVRGRLFVWPWKYRRRLMRAIRHRFGLSRRSINQHPSTAAGG
jgi:glycosyltransferase involved in cell wall biosynthesis